LQYGLVAIKTGNSYTAQKIKRLPFSGVSQQILTIAGDIGQSELNDTFLKAFTYLFAYLTKARPAHAQLRQHPLQKTDTVRIFHL